MMRQTNWPARLNAFIEQRRKMPFAWGGNDCCLFVCDWISLLTGIDPAKKLRGTYADALSAARVLKRHRGVEAIAARQCRANGWPSVPVVSAMRGDIVSLPTEHGAALGICLGRHAAFPGPAGLVFVALHECRHAWNIP